MRVLVTGSLGFIGQEICSHLERNSFDVVRLARKRYEASQHILEWDLGNDTDIESLSKAIGSVDAVVHTAAQIEIRSGDLGDMLRSNCGGTDQVCKVAKACGATKLVFLSSIQVLKPSINRLREDSEIKPASIYHATKLTGEYILQSSAGNNLDVIIFRVTSPVGKNMNAGKIFRRFVENSSAGKKILIYGDGSRVQNYVHVNDISEAVRKGLMSNATGIYNLGGLESLSNLELAKRCITVLESESKIGFAGCSDPEAGIHWNVSSELAAKELGYSPKMSIDASIVDIATNTKSLK